VQRRGELAQTGPYAYVRHPQYVAFILIMLGFLLQWPTLLTLLMCPILVITYVRLARREEQEVRRGTGGTVRALRRAHIPLLSAFISGSGGKYSGGKRSALSPTPRRAIRAPLQIGRAGHLSAASRAPEGRPGRLPSRALGRPAPRGVQGSSVRVHGNAGEGTPRRPTLDRGGSRPRGAEIAPQDMALILITLRRRGSSASVSGLRAAFFPTS
jgi:hypothetical protein